MLRAHLRRSVESFLSAQGIAATDLKFYAVNPSDHRVLGAAASVLDIPAHLMQPAWAAWERHGNTLSAGPLYVVDALRRLASSADGDLGLVVVLGPGLTCDLMLLRWHAPFLN
jgi:alkylresorcinol/alkylpyrone synthase